MARVDTSVPGNEFYMLNMYPYPSGSRLHVGHGRNYILGDALYRRERMAGRKALNPMGWDAFGLPAENAAIQSGVPPREYTLGNIARMKEQLYALGCLYDWSKELASCDPAYYRWNQWLFLRMWEKGLAYRKTAPVNWCPGCRTVLANEQVVDGRCERSGDAVAIRDLTQWFFRVTDYAERLLDGPRPPAALVRPRQDDAAKLDRALRGRGDPVRRRGAGRARHRIHDAPRHAVRRDLPGAGAGARRGRAPGRIARPRRPRSKLSSSACVSSPGSTANPREATRKGSRPEPSRSTRPPARKSRSGWRTSCCPSTAPARSWGFRRTTSGTSSSRASTACRSGRSTGRRRGRSTPRR